MTDTPSDGVPRTRERAGYSYSCQMHRHDECRKVVSCACKCHDRRRLIRDIKKRVKPLDTKPGF